MVFHPAWQYFATEYNLIQLAIEIDGKNPNPKTIKFIINEAKKEDIKAIFTAPEFSIKTAKIIAKELNIKVIQISPLNQKWANNLIKFAKAIANNK
jgi:zinc transport system substrate-binding protein